MVYASSGLHLDASHDANRLAQEDVQPETGAIAPDAQIPIPQSHALVESGPRKVSTIKARRISRLHESAAVGLALGGLLVGYVAWRLSEGTISIAIAKPIVESSLEKVIGGSTKIGSLRLGWDDGRREFVVTATQISATTDARTSPLSLGQVNLSLDARALLLGQAQIKRADLTGLQAVVVIDKQGRTAFGFGTPAEVLALPRIKREAQSLRAILSSVRKSVYRNKTSGPVEAIVLSNATLTIIDPDTGQRLTLAEAKAGVTTDANDVVTLQATGLAREMGGRANIAISASPNVTDRLVVAGVFSQARLALLPASLKLDALSQINNDTSPVSGNFLVYLGEGTRPYDVRASLALGQGQFQGLDVRRASGSLIWNGQSRTGSFQNVSLEATQAQVEAASGTFVVAQNGSKSADFSAKTFAYDRPDMGRIGGRDVRGSFLLAADNMPKSGTLNGREVTYVRGTTDRIAGTDIQVTLATPNANQPSRTNLTLKAQNLSGLLLGQNLIATLVDANMIAMRSGDRIQPSDISGYANRFAYGVTRGGLTQSFDAQDINLVASGFAGPSTWMPNRVQVSAREIGLGGDPSAFFQGRVSGLGLEAQNLQSGRGTVQGRVSVLSAQNESRGIALSGRSILIDGLQTGAQSGRINALSADTLGVSAIGGTFGFTNLRASTNLNPDGLSDTKLVAKSVEIIHPTQLQHPFWADDLRLQGSLGPRAIDLQVFSLRHRGVDIVGNTQIASAARGSPRVDLVADVNGAFSVETLMSAWPKRFLPETRGNIARLVPAGTAEVSQLVLAIPAGMKPKDILPRNGIELDFDLRDVTVTYLNGMSPITNVSGRGYLTGNSLLIDLPFGQVGDVKLTGGKVEIPQFMPRGAHALIDAKIDGRARDMAREIDMPSLSIMTKSGIEPERLSGTGTATLSLDIPLKANLQGDEIGVKVDGQFADVALSRAFAGIDANQGDVRLKVRDDLVEVAGLAKLAGNPFEFTWSNARQEDGSTEGRLIADGVVAIESLTELDLDLAPYARGTARVSVISQSHGSRFGSSLINADLVNTNIILPGNVWTKPEGVAAQASADLFPREGGGWHVQNVRFSAASASLQGAVDLSEDADVVDARFSRIIIPNAADLSANVTPAPSGMIVTLSGNYLNLSPFLQTKNISEQAVQLLDRPLTLSADIKKVATSEQNTLDNVHADIVRDLQGWRTLSATGTSPAGQSQIQLDVLRDGRRTISGVLSDAGFFAQLLYPGAPITGGTGVIEGELPVAGANSSGVLTFTGKDIAFDREGTSPIVFDNVRLPMSVRGGVITLRDGQADGAAYTVKANGYVDVGAGRLDIRGVATPGGLNRALSDIPLFGPILGGGQDEGLVGMTFTAKGTLSAPRLITNPISALAPGFLRKLFESNIPISPQPRLVVTNLAGDPIVTKWPYGPTEDMSEPFVAQTAPSTRTLQSDGPVQ